MRKSVRFISTTSAKSLARTRAIIGVMLFLIISTGLEVAAEVAAPSESSYDSADNWNFPNDNYWVCGKLKKASAPVRYSDGSLVNGGAGYDVSADGSTRECGADWIRFDLHEILEVFDGTKTNYLAFHKGGQGYSPATMTYGHILLDDIASFEGAVAGVSSAKNVPQRGAEGAGSPQVCGKPPEYGAPSWDPEAKRWNLTRRNGRGCDPIEPTIYAVKLVPRGSPDDIPESWQYKPNMTSSRFNKYADAGPDLGDGSSHFAYLCWSWMHRGDGMTINRGGGMVRALLRDGQEVRRCPVKPIRSVAYVKGSNKVAGEVTAVYVKTRASAFAPWLYGWMIASHRARLADGTFGPAVNHLIVSR
jgi:hypothetical protein